MALVAEGGKTDWQRLLEAYNKPPVPPMFPVSPQQQSPWGQLYRLWRQQDWAVAPGEAERPITRAAYEKLIEERVKRTPAAVMEELRRTAEDFTRRGFVEQPEQFVRLEVGDWAGQDAGLSKELAHLASQRVSPGIRERIQQMMGGRDVSVSPIKGAWLPTIMKQVAEREELPPDVEAFIRAGLMPEAAAEAIAAPPGGYAPGRAGSAAWDYFMRAWERATAEYEPLPEPTLTEEEKERLAAIGIDPEAYEMGILPYAVPKEVTELPVPPRPIEEQPTAGQVWGALKAVPGLGVAPRTVEEAARAGITIISQGEYILERAVGMPFFVHPEAPGGFYAAMARLPGVVGAGYEWAPVPEVVKKFEEARTDRIASKLREIDLPPADKFELARTTWTWMASPERLEAALDDMIENDLTIDEVVRKHEWPVAEAIGQIVTDPLTYVGVALGKYRDYRLLEKVRKQFVLKVAPELADAIDDIPWYKRAWTSVGGKVDDLNPFAVMAHSKARALDRHINSYMGMVISKAKTKDDAITLVRRFMDAPEKLPPEFGTFVRSPNADEVRKALKLIEIDTFDSLKPVTAEMVKQMALAGMEMPTDEFKVMDFLAELYDKSIFATNKLYDVKPVTSAERWAQGFKSYMADFYLGISPRAVIRNAAGNVTFLSWDGLMGMTAANQIDDYMMACFGFSPMQAQRGLGLAKEYAGPSRGVPIVHDLAEIGRKVYTGDTPLIGESWARYQGTYQAMRKFDNLYWRPGQLMDLSPFDDIWPHLTPSTKANLIAAWRQSLNADELVENTRRALQGGRMAAKYLDDAEEVSPGFVRAVQSVIDDATDAAGTLDQRKLVRGVDDLAAELEKRAAKAAMRDGVPPKVFEPLIEEVVPPPAARAVVEEAVPPPAVSRMAQRVRRYDLGEAQTRLDTLRKFTGEAETGKRKVAAGVLDDWAEEMGLLQRRIAGIEETLARGMPTPKEAALLPGIEYAEELRAGRPPEVAKRMYSTMVREQAQYGTSTEGFILDAQEMGRAAYELQMHEKGEWAANAWRKYVSADVPFPTRMNDVRRLMEDQPDLVIAWQDYLIRQMAAKNTPSWQVLQHDPAVKDIVRMLPLEDVQTLADVRPSAKLELEELLGVLPEVADPDLPADIGVLARHAGVDPTTAGYEEWERVLGYANERFRYHELRSIPEGLDSIAAKEAMRLPQDGWLFGEWRQMRVGRMSAKQEKAFRRSLIPPDMSRREFFDYHGDAAQVYFDLAEEIEAFLGDVPRPVRIADTMDAKALIRLEAGVQPVLPVVYPRPEVWEIPVERITPERLPTAPIPKGPPLLTDQELKKAKRYVELLREAGNPKAARYDEFAYTPLADAFVKHEVTEYDEIVRILGREPTVADLRTAEGMGAIDQGHQVATQKADLISELQRLTGRRISTVEDADAALASLKVSPGTSKNIVEEIALPGVEAVPAAIKEPWQLTREEFGTAAIGPFMREEPHPYATLIKQYEGEFRATQPVGRADIGDFVHRRIVEQAVAAGQPVPTEVLAEYPDLAAPAARVPGEFPGMPRLEVAAAAPPPAAAPATVVTRGAVNRAEAAAVDLAADYKARGIERQAAYSRFVQDRNLKPEMDAKEFFGLYDQASPRLLEGVATEVGFTPTHFDTVTQQPVMVTGAEGQHKIVWQMGMEGGHPRREPLPERFVPIEQVAPAARVAGALQPDEVVKVTGTIDQYAYRSANEYSLNRLEGIIGTTYDEETRRAYIANWFDRAQTMAQPSPTGGMRPDMAEIAERVRHRQVTWSAYLEPTPELKPAGELLDQVNAAHARWLELKRAGAPADEIEAARVDLARLSTRFREAGGMEAVAQAPALPELKPGDKVFETLQAEPEIGTVREMILDKDRGVLYAQVDYGPGRALQELPFDSLTKVEEVPEAAAEAAALARFKARAQKKVEGVQEVIAELKQRGLSLEDFQSSLRKGLDPRLKGVTQNDLWEVGIRGFDELWQTTPPPAAFKQPWEMTGAEYAQTSTEAFLTKLEREAETAQRMPGASFGELRDEYAKHGLHVFKAKGKYVIQHPSGLEARLSVSEEALADVPARLKSWAKFARQTPDFVAGAPYAEHEGLVARALAEGREVPARVLADYPDLAAPAAGRVAIGPPWDETFNAAVARVESEPIASLRQGTVGDGELEIGYRMAQIAAGTDAPSLQAVHSHSIQTTLNLRPGTVEPHFNMKKLRARLEDAGFAIEEGKVIAPPAAARVPGEFPGMPRLEMGAPGVAQMEVPLEAARGEVLLGKAAEKYRRAEMAARQAGAPMLPGMEVAEEVITPAMRSRRMSELSDEIAAFQKRGEGKVGPFRDWVDAQVARRQDEMNRLLAEALPKAAPPAPPAAAVPAAEILQPITDDQLSGMWELGGGRIEHVAEARRGHLSLTTFPDEGIAAGVGDLYETTAAGKVRALGRWSYEADLETGQVKKLWQPKVTGRRGPLVARADHPDVVALIESELRRVGLTGVPGPGAAPPAAVGSEKMAEAIKKGTAFTDDYGFDWKPVSPPETQLKNYIKVRTKIDGQDTIFYTYKTTAAKDQARILSAKLAEAVPTRLTPVIPEVAPALSKQAAGLRQKADAMASAIEKKRHPAIAGQRMTARRAGIAAGMAEEADALARIQAKLYAIADRMEAGTLPESLAVVKHKADVETLESMAQQARWAAQRANLPGALTRPLDDELLRFANMPRWEEDLKKLRKLGVSTEQDLRAILRDYASLEVVAGRTAEEIRLAELERSLIGRAIPGYFPTPRPLADEMVGLAGIEPGMKVLEPSAGKGNIAEAVLAARPGTDLSVIEWNRDLGEILRLKGFNVVDDDFLKHTGQYDRIIMNPPFEKGQDIDHVRHAYDQLEPGGRVVAIMSEGTFARSDAKATAFQEWLDEAGGYGRQLPPGSFRSSERPTGVATRLVVIDKPGVEGVIAAMDDAALQAHIGELRKAIDRAAIDRPGPLKMFPTDEERALTAELEPFRLEMERRVAERTAAKLAAQERAREAAAAAQKRAALAERAAEIPETVSMEAVPYAMGIDPTELRKTEAGWRLRGAKGTYFVEAFDPAEWEWFLVSSGNYKQMAESYKFNVGNDPLTVQELRKGVERLRSGLMPPYSAGVESAADAERGVLRRLLDDETGAVRLPGLPVAVPEVPGPLVAPELQEEIARRVFQNLVPARNDANMAKLQWAYEVVNRSLYDYDKRYEIDRWIGLFYPFHFWPTRTAYESSVRMLTKPWTVTSYYRIQKAIESINQDMGFPKRYGRTALPVPVPEGAVPEWAEPVAMIDLAPYIWPQTEVFPFNQLARIDWDDNDEAKTGLDRVADMQALWGMSPHWPLGYGLDMARGKEEEIGYVLPQTGVLRGLTAALKERYPERFDWIPPGGINIEKPFRTGLGLPLRPGYEDVYWPESMVLDMAATGEITPEERDAIVNPSSPQYHQGPIWDEAVNRAAILKQVPGLVSYMTGIRPGIVPKGEMKLREAAREELGPIYERERAGERGPEIREERSRWFRENPWYMGRGLLWTPGPEREVQFREREYIAARNDIYERYAAQLDSVPVWDNAARQPIFQTRQAELDRLDATYPDVRITPSFWGWAPGEIETYYEDSSLRPVADAYYAIRPEDYADDAGNANWAAFYKAREEFLQNVHDRAIDQGLLDKDALAEMGIKGKPSKLPWLTRSRFERYLRRNDDPKEALWKAYKDTVIAPARDRMYAEIAEAQEKERATPSQVYERYYAAYGPRPATDFITRVLAMYPEKGWAFGELEREYQGITLPGLKEVQELGRSPREEAIADLWDFYVALPTLDKKRLREDLGERFARFFVAKDTRNYNVIGDEELIYWMTYTGLDPGMLPEMAEAGGAPARVAEAQQMVETRPERRPTPPPTFEVTPQFIPSDPAVSAEYQRALDERSAMWQEIERQWPGYSEWSDLYSALQPWQVEERDALKEVLQPAWDFRRKYLEAHPLIEKWLYSEPSDDPRADAIADLWNFYMALSALDKRRLKDELGDRFSTYFVNKDSRNYDKISTEELTAWLGYVGLDSGLGPLVAQERADAAKAWTIAGKPIPEPAEPAAPAPTPAARLAPAPGTDVLQAVAGVFSPSSPNVSAEYDQAIAERDQMWLIVDTLWPDYSAMMDAYNGLKWWQFDEREALKVALDPAWRFMDEWKLAHPTMTKWLYPTWQPYVPKEKAPAAPRARKPTQEEVLTGEAKEWEAFAKTVEDPSLLELIQSWLLLSPAQRDAFVARYPKLAAWLKGKDAAWLAKLAASLGAHLALRKEKPRRAARPPTLRWYARW